MHTKPDTEFWPAMERLADLVDYRAAVSVLVGYDIEDYGLVCHLVDLGFEHDEPIENAANVIDGLVN